jgi:hypothetical protein
MPKGRTYTIDRFLGVNEAPDGDTGLKMGEAADMVNFRITAEGNLQIRPGYRAVVTLTDGKPVRGMWRGYAGGVECWLAACNGHVYSINLTTLEATDLGTLTDAPTEFFAFGGNVYILNGNEYKKWTGTGSITDVEGYVPIIRIAAAPSTGSGTALEQVNKLTGSKWVWYSALHDSTTFQLPETGLASVDTVEVNNAEVTTGFTVDLTAGTVTFSSAPGAGTNNIKIQYTKTSASASANRTLILSQKFYEMYNGYTDNRVFLYGDGTNKAYYSGLEYESGLPTAEYFPDLNVLDVGETNTPITSIVRHFNKLFCQKIDGTYLTYSDYFTDAEGNTVFGLMTSPVARDIGNDALGQVRLVNNYPISLHGNSVYRWSFIYSTGTQDERAAKRISDRVRETLGGFTLPSVVTFDDEWNREYWLINSDGNACIYQYANEAQGDTSYKYNVWYRYDNIPATCFVSVGGELYFGSPTGYIMHMSRRYHSDNGAELKAYWETGSMHFDAMQLRKYIRQIFVGLKPEAGARITLAAESDNRSDYEEKTLAHGLATYLNFDYSCASYNTNRKPKTKRAKFKIKKFTHCKLILKSNSKTAAATVTALTVPVEYGSYAK